MGACCSSGYEKLFGTKQARRDANRYRRKGLDATAQRLVAELSARGVAGTSLEVGGGVGAIEVELLGKGVEHATIVELSHGYDEEAAKLAREAGVADRLDRRYGDFVELEGLVKPAEVVVMHKVICCYPDPETLVGAAASHSRRLLALSFPRVTWWMRVGTRLINLWCRLTGGIETYLHDPGRVVAIAERAGMRTVVHERSGRIWRIAVFERP